MKKLKKILVTGGNGQLAYDLRHSISKQESAISLFAFNRSQLDVTQYDLVEKTIAKIQPDFVINTAAYTQVDRAEQESLQAFLINRDGAKNLAIACERFSCPLIHVSTDYVFDGQRNHPYSETDTVNPLSVYGESKFRGEEQIQKFCEAYMILRVSAVFGVHGNNFVKTILRLANEKDQLQVVSDQWTCPTPAAAIAEALLTMCQKPQWGVYHYCGDRAVNWYEFAKIIIERARNHKALSVNEVQAITSSEYSVPAKRPQYSVLNCEKIKNTFGIEQAHWEKGLNDVITTLYST